jgi:hypothetical protein
MKNAIAQINDSRTAEGATMSRAPTRQQQYIPPFSLWWIGMVHDYWWYQDDPEFVREMLPGVRAVLGFFAGHEKSNGSLRQMPWWNYVDWAWRQTNGVPPMADDGSSAVIDLQHLLALDWATLRKLWARKDRRLNFAKRPPGCVRLSGRFIGTRHGNCSQTRPLRKSSRSRPIRWRFSHELSRETTRGRSSIGCLTIRRSPSPLTTSATTSIRL